MKLDSAFFTFFIGVIVTIVGGAILGLIMPWISGPPDPRRNVFWGSHHVATVRDFDGALDFSQFAIFNRGRDSWRDLIITFDGQPRYLFARAELEHGGTRDLAVEIVEDGQLYRAVIDVIPGRSTVLVSVFSDYYLDIDYVHIGDLEIPYVFGAELTVYNSRLFGFEIPSIVILALFPFFVLVIIDWLNLRIYFHRLKKSADVSDEN